MSGEDLAARFGAIDIYLFDQILRGRVSPGARVLDAGCGGGRNLVYLLREGYDVSAADRDAGAVAAVRRLASELAPALPDDHFRVEPLEGLTFADASFDVVIASAVLHFARDDAHFSAMLDGLWRVLAPGGVLFTRLASTIGMEGRARPIGGGRYHLPDGSDRYLVDADALAGQAQRLGGTLLDPLKTTIVQDQRAMTTWVLGKP
ncbi:MAG: class I SAM-dependent methyltransferase [Vicinamibacterales bacterium]